jgi:hypothetical protein
MQASSISVLRNERSDASIFAIGIGIFVAIAIFFKVVGLSLIQSDVRDYLVWSNEWWHVQDPFHLPVYPVLIWLARGLTFGLLPDGMAMQFVSLLGWCASVYFVAKTLEFLRVKGRHWAVALYALFPFVGVSYAAWPISDSIAHAALAAAVYFLYRREWWPLTATLALSLLIHKALWPFALGIAIVGVWRHGYPLTHFVLSGVPLVIYWLIGVFNGEQLSWMVHSNLHKEIASHSSLPVFDGVFGTLASGGARGLIKGGLLLSLLIASVVLGAIHLKRRHAEMVVLILPIFALLMILNQWEAWAPFRFAKILAIPAVMALQPGRVFSSLDRRPWAYWTFIIVLGLSQLVFAFYMDRFFAARNA